MLMPKLIVSLAVAESQHHWSQSEQTALSDDVSLIVRAHNETDDELPLLLAGLVGGDRPVRVSEVGTSLDRGALLSVCGNVAMDVAVQRWW